jgi:hypothetical protein
MSLLRRRPRVASVTQAVLRLRRLAAAVDQIDVDVELGADIDHNSTSATA